jgi:hypothetical protein
MPAPHARMFRWNADVIHYAILCVDRGVAWFAERGLADCACRETTIRDIISGEVAGVEKVIAFNCAEHTADDVTADIAIAIARRLDPAERVRAELLDFVETHAGLAFARGLRRADPAFAAE